MKTTLPLAFMFVCAAIATESGQARGGSSNYNYNSGSGSSSSSSSNSGSTADSETNTTSGTSNADAIPTGTLTASPGIVAVGAFPTLNWKINYPTTVEDVVDIEDDEIIPETKVTAQIRVLGAGVTSSYADGSNLRFVHTEGYYSYNGGNYERLFAGTNHDVNQNKVVWSGSVEPGCAMRFGGRYYFNNKWSNFYSSNDGTNNVRILKNGDSIPTTYNIATAPSLEDFIKPYLDAGGKVRIGPMDLIVMMELTHTKAQRNEVGYDLQDLVFLVTFKK
jgi:hypothetical protein